MGVGAVLASFVGTTGAAMLLIRPLLETNGERRHVAHTVVLFIFIVCNCGGLLLPIGDPPLFLGYLEGVPFLWTMGLWPEWLFVNGLLIATYFLLDALWFYRREAQPDVARDTARTHRIRIDGWQINVPMLIGVVLAIALLDPSKPLPGTDWHPWMYLARGCAAGAGGDFVVVWQPAGAQRQPLYVRRDPRSGRAVCRDFHLHAAGAADSGEQGERAGTGDAGALFLDDGHACLACSIMRRRIWCSSKRRKRCRWTGVAPVAGVDPHILAAISLGAVFMGAMTYIGNGPNFMVRSIAESSGVKMPSFFGYVVYSVLILLPILGVTVWVFLM